MRSSTPLRILCLEDNPLIAFHIEQMIEDLGHIAELTLSSFADLQAIARLMVDCALVDIDLSDGRTGPTAARWLGERNIPCLFVSGQQDIAAAHAGLVVGTINKPVSIDDLARALGAIAS